MVVEAIGGVTAGFSDGVCGTVGNMELGVIEVRCNGCFDGMALGDVDEGSVDGVTLGVTDEMAVEAFDDVKEGFSDGFVFGTFAGVELGSVVLTVEGSVGLVLG